MVRRLRGHATTEFPLMNARAELDACRMPRRKESLLPLTVVVSHASGVASRR
jgi:hypothetical protein